MTPIHLIVGIVGAGIMLGRVFAHRPESEEGPEGDCKTEEQTIAKPLAKCEPVGKTKKESMIGTETGAAVVDIKAGEDNNPAHSTGKGKQTPTKPAKIETTE